MEFTLLQGCPLHSHSRGLLPSASPSVFSGITASWLAVCAGFFLPQALFNGQFLLPGTSSVYTLLQPSSWPPPVWHEFLLSIDQLEVLHWLHKRCPSVALVTSCFHLAVRMVFHLLPLQLTVLVGSVLLPGLCVPDARLLTSCRRLLLRPRTGLWRCLHFACGSSVHLLAPPS